MTKKRYIVKPNYFIHKCPKCGNNTDFTCIANQVGEDVCDVWVECMCGYDPTEEKTSYRVEDVWGSVDFEMFQCCIRHSWNELVAETDKKEAE